MSDLMGQMGELRFVLEVTRKDTGAVETYDLIGHIIGDDDAPVEPTKDTE